MDAVSRAEPKDHASSARLTAIARAHSGFIWRTARRLGLAADVADDALQQVLIIAARKLDQIEEGAERAFLYRTTAHITAELRRTNAKQAGRRAPLDHEMDPPDDAPRADEMISQQQARRMLDAILDALEDDLREVFVLFELEEMSMSEIATLVGIPEGTVASRLRRARERFVDASKRLRARQKWEGAA